MPLPLPDLDTRRWSDLVEEGRALVPRYAPGWTDHNAHDPGITLIELFAWLAEGAMYRANRVTARSRRKFLSLVGYDPMPPRPASIVVALQHSGGPPRALPAGLVLEATVAGQPPIRAAVDADLTMVDAQPASLFLLEGGTLVDQSRALAAPMGLPLFGPDPAPGAGFAIGFDRPVPPDTWVNLGIELVGDTVTRAELARAAREAQEQRAACAPLPRDPCGPPRKGCPCPDDSVTRRRRKPVHHCTGASGEPAAAWEYYGAAGWSPLGEDDVEDGTASLTWSGIVRFRVSDVMAPLSLGSSPARYWLRCRLLSGDFDVAPGLVALVVNAATITQEERPVSQFPVDAGAAIIGAAPAPGTEMTLDVAFDPAGRIASLGTDPGPPAVPRALIAEYAAPGLFDGVLAPALVRLTDGSGLPWQRMALPHAMVVGLSLWSFEGNRWRRWTQRIDLDASRASDAHFTLDAGAGEVAFGDGERGRVVPPDAPVLATYRYTRGALGNVPPGVAWTVADTPISRAMLGAEFAPALLDVAAVTGVALAIPGSAPETVAEAAGRAASALWAHELLVTLAEDAGSDTLDGLDTVVVRAATPPARATTALDYERLALQVPGTAVRRARAWASLDLAAPGVRALGTVTVMILPALPRKRPMPSRRLLTRVRRFLDRRRILGTRLQVSGPRYVEIQVVATITILPRAGAARVQRAVREALDRFLDPLRGGPGGRGWPFGRDVYRSEILQTIDEVRGVDHVVSMVMTADGAEVDCGNVCIGPASLVSSGEHQIEVSS